MNTSTNTLRRAGHPDAAAPSAARTPTKSNSLIPVLALLTAVLSAIPALHAQAIMVTASDGSSNDLQRVIEFNPVDGTSSTFAMAPDVQNPFGITFDAAGNLYVVNSAGGNSVAKFSPTGEYKGVFATVYLDSPEGVAFDGLGNLYVASNNSSTIVKYGPDGILLLSPFASTPYPAGIAFDRTGNLYVVNSAGGANTIHKFGPNGEDLNTFGDTTYLHDPIALAFDSGGNLYVTNSADNTIAKFDPDGVGSIIVRTNLNVPYAIAVDELHDLIYVTNNGDGTIHKFTTSGVDMGEFASGLRNPNYIAIQPVVEQHETPESSQPETILFTKEPLGISITFQAVTTAGITTVAAGPTGPNAPSGFQFGSQSIYYHLSTTAVYSGPITIAINFSGVDFGGSTPQLNHYEFGAWQNVTTSVDLNSHIIYGSVTSLSPFALFAQEPAYVAAVQPPINPDGTSVFKKNRGDLPVKFTLSAEGRRITALPPAVISLKRQDGSAFTTIPLRNFSAPSDNGRFRIDPNGNQYTYNLVLPSLGVGAYKVVITIAGRPVGSATFVVN